MKAIMVSVIFAIGVATATKGQGYFGFDNPDAPTHLGSIDGPLAGPGIWAQALAGLTPDSLTPVGPPRQHYQDGYINGTDVSVPFGIRIGAGSAVFAQMAAWDGRILGTDFSKVPQSQFGYTDVVLVFLDVPPGPLLEPNWTQSAIVPLVPEPTTAALVTLGAALLLLSRWHSPVRHHAACSLPARRHKH